MSEFWLVLPSAAAALLAVVVVYLLVALRRLRRDQERLADENRALRSDLGSLCTGAVGVSERVARLEGQARRLTERQDQLELTGGETRPYDRAIDLALKGATADDLVRECGLTHGEADLVVMMHRMEQS